MCEIWLSLTTPSEIHGDVSGQPGTEFVVRRRSAAGAGVATMCSMAVGLADNRSRVAANSPYLALDHAR